MAAARGVRCLVAKDRILLYTSGAPSVRWGMRHGIEVPAGEAEGKMQSESGAEELILRPKEGR
jgi:hypothetical protein